MHPPAMTTTARPFERTFRHTLVERWLMLPMAPILVATAAAWAC